MKKAKTTHVQIPNNTDQFYLLIDTVQEDIISSGKKKARSFSAAFKNGITAFSCLVFWLAFMILGDHLDS